MAEETPETPGADDRTGGREERPSTRGDRRDAPGGDRQGQDRQDRGSDRRGSDRSGTDRRSSDRRGSDRDERGWRSEGTGSERRGGRSEWRPRGAGAEQGGWRDRPTREGERGGYRGGERGPRREGERGGYRGGERGPRRDDDRGGYRGGGEDRGPRRGDRDGFRGHSQRGGADRPYRDDDGRPRGPRPERKPEPEIPEHIEAGQLDRAARRELLTLSKENADGVARHLVAAAEALETGDLDGALAHAENASRRAGRVAIVREVLGFVHYRRAEWAEALREFRTARRLSGSHHLLPHMADVERGLGRPDRAIELAQDPAAQSLTAADRVELAIVVSGARRDLGQHDAAVQTLRGLVQASPAERSWAPRLYYAYAESLLGDGDAEGAREWFGRSLDADRDGLTEASERLAELDGVDITDLDEDEDSEGAGATAPEQPAGTRADDAAGTQEP